MAARVVVLDYGSGNIRSAQRALERVGAEVTVTSDAVLAADADGLVVPGVGAFAACMSGLLGVGGDVVIRERLAADRPVLGICVGMQILYGNGVEHGLDTPGVGVLEGTVDRLEAHVLPHMGWNTLEPPEGSVLFHGVEGERFYFVHSYAAQQSSMADEATWAEHGSRFVAAVERGRLSATQFHPEKSGDAGAHLLENWLRSV
ncbi:MAG: imidazole glycerol-phosphate synthase subunit HisH [Frankiales bacterium]|jgi:glutamine amidotransferase|nr:imidazole glycerol-phosphate synthase subunit HisH [Frankiales bacterium]MDX6222496.1 imidazole glycerol-phosphate synthase subunit HisH [Frankiales bacterium]